MTRLALGAKSSGFTAPFDPGFAACAARSSDGFKSEFNAVSPSPADVRPRNARRVALRVRCSIMASIPGIDFVEVQDHTCDRGHGCHHRRDLIISQRGLAFAQKI